MNYSILLDVVGLEQKHLDSGLVPNIAKVTENGEVAKLEPTFPAVTSTVQASILSGSNPARLSRHKEYGIASSKKILRKLLCSFGKTLCMRIQTLW